MAVHEFASLARRSAGRNVVSFASRRIETTVHVRHPYTFARLKIQCHRLRCCIWPATLKQRVLRVPDKLAIDQLEDDINELLVLGY